MRATFQPVRMQPPFCCTVSATYSQSCPGPNLGYMNCSISDVSVSFCPISPLFLLPNVDFTKCVIALVMDSPLIRCAPHSALIRSHGTPQTFSVYDLKNNRYSWRPKRLIRKSSSDFSILH